MIGFWKAQNNDGAMDLRKLLFAFKGQSGNIFVVQFGGVVGADGSLVFGHTTKLPCQNLELMFAHVFNSQLQSLCFSSREVQTIRPAGSLLDIKLKGLSPLSPEIEIELFSWKHC